MSSTAALATLYQPAGVCERTAVSRASRARECLELLSMRRCVIFIGENHVCEWQYLSCALWVESHFRYKHTPYHKMK